MGVEYLADPELILCHFTSSLRCTASQRQVSLYSQQHKRRKIIPERRPCWTFSSPIHYQNWADLVMRLAENQLGLRKIGPGAPYQGASIAVPRHKTFSAPPRAGVSAVVEIQTKHEENVVPTG